MLGDNSVKVGPMKWRSIDGSRQFRVVPDDYSFDGLGHRMGGPKILGQPHVHLSFFRMTVNGNFVVTKNIHIPLLCSKQKKVNMEASTLLVIVRDVVHY